MCRRAMPTRRVQRVGFPEGCGARLNRIASSKVGNKEGQGRPGRGGRRFGRTMKTQQGGGWASRRGRIGWVLWEKQHGKPCEPELRGRQIKRVVTARVCCREAGGACAATRNHSASQEFAFTFALVPAPAFRVSVTSANACSFWRCPSCLSIHEAEGVFGCCSLKETHSKTSKTSKTRRGSRFVGPAGT